MTELTNLRSKLRSQYIKIDPNAKVWNNDTLDGYLNDAQDQLTADLNNKIPEQEESGTLTTTSGTETYDLPEGFVVIDKVALGTQWVRKTSKSATILKSSSNSQPSQYYLYGGKIGFYPIPDSAYSFEYTYYKELPTITSTEDCALPSSYDSALCSYAAYLAFNGVSKDVKADRMFANYTNQLTKLSGKYLYQDEEISFGTQRFGAGDNDQTLNMGE